LPQVRVYDASEIPEMLEYPEYQVKVTEESRKRRQMYKAEEKRSQLKQSKNSVTIDFLKKCHMKLKIFVPEKEADKNRCFELAIRTNQLNMSGRKYSEAEFNDVLQRTGHQNFAFSCGDDFGEYGIVGFGQYRTEDGELIFTELAMSCRVAGKYVESALLAELLKRERCKCGAFEVKKTKKNILLRNTLSEIGFDVIEEDGHQIRYRFDGNLRNAEIISVE